jgi:hypothetical protein
MVSSPTVKGLIIRVPYTYIQTSVPNLWFLKMLWLNSLISTVNKKKQFSPCINKIFLTDISNRQKSLFIRIRQVNIANDRFLIIVINGNKTTNWYPALTIHIIWCLEASSTHKLTTWQFDTNKASTQQTVCCDNLLPWHSVSKWMDCLSTPNCDIPNWKIFTVCHSLTNQLVVIIFPKVCDILSPWFSSNFAVTFHLPVIKDPFSGIYRHFYPLLHFCSVWQLILKGPHLWAWRQNTARPRHGLVHMSFQGTVSWDFYYYFFFLKAPSVFWHRYW